MLRKIESKIVFRIVMLTITLAVSSWILVNGPVVYLLLLLPILIFQLVEFFQFQNKTFAELNSFVESVKYKDFSRHFDVKHAPAELQSLRKGFNQINDAFKIISKEKEIQYQYLQKILEMVNTGILSFETETGEVIWMNESLKQMLQLPYLKTIHSLEKRDQELYHEIIQLQPGNGKIAMAHPEKGHFKVLLSASVFSSENKAYKLVAFQNINAAVDETEAKAWQKLLSVMTHEIMNSVAPISSLAGTLKNRLDNSIAHLNNETGAVDDLSLGIDTIKKRSEGLLRFAETYRNLNKITKPNLNSEYVIDLFENICNLMQPTLDQKNIEIEMVMKEPSIKIEVDSSLIEQVLINLLLNAIEAVKEKEDPRIILSAEENFSKNRVLIKVSDNGVGMSEEVLEQIFVPFFTTKKSGSGIGLSLCKQIMMVHKGSLDVQSKEGEGTVFSLIF